MQENFPIWFCLVQDDPFIQQLRVRRIIKAVKTTLTDVEQVYKDHEALCYGPNRVIPEMFHRDPTDSPLLEVARKSEVGLVPLESLNMDRTMTVNVTPEDIDVALDMTEYTDW